MKIGKTSSATNTVKHPNLRAARNGALITTGILTSSAGFSWVTRTDAMKQSVKECGGTANYIKTFALGVAILSAAGALINTAISVAARKIPAKHPPKAAN